MEKATARCAPGRALSGAPGAPDGAVAREGEPSDVPNQVVADAPEFVRVPDAGSSPSLFDGASAPLTAAPAAWSAKFRALRQP